MKFIQSFIATAGLAFIASAATTEIYKEVTTDLPAHFAMYLVTDEPRANGLRIRYGGVGDFYINLNLRRDQNPVDAVFLGGRGRIALDRTVHPHPGLNTPEPWGDWNLALRTGLYPLIVVSEQTQAKMASWGANYIPIVGKFVQNRHQLLRVVGSDGELLPNGFRVCGASSDYYSFWWDDVPYLPCPIANFRIVPL